MIIARFISYSIPRLESPSAFRIRRLVNPVMTMFMGSEDGLAYHVCR